MSGTFGADPTEDAPQATLGVGGTVVGSELSRVLLCEQIVPGSTIGYELAKVIYSYHPIGAKLADTPIKMAQSQERKVTMPNSPDEAIDRFQEQWKLDDADLQIANTARLSRVYGISTLVWGIEGKETDVDIPLEEMTDAKIYFNVLDPLNTSGSLVLNQDPNAPDFQKLLSITVAGQKYARSRVCVLMNEQPIYIEYTDSAYGFVGRSVYQRPLFALKSFIQTMLTDDVVSQKAGVIIAKIKPAGSIMDRLMSGFNAIKRTILKGSRNNNVIAISPEEDIESLNLQNLEGPAKMARQNILQNIAMAADMPSQLVANETFVEGFSEGENDFKQVARYIDSVRNDLAKLYDFVTFIIQVRAWGPAFFEAMQAKYPDVYGNMKWSEFFYTLRNDFKAVWPSLLTEPDSEKIKVDEAKLKACKDVFDSLVPIFDPENIVRLVQWVASNLNENEMLFKTPLIIDEKALLQFLNDKIEQAKELAAQGAMAAPGGAANESGAAGAKTPPGAPRGGQEDAPETDDDDENPETTPAQKIAA